MRAVFQIESIHATIDLPKLSQAELTVEHVDIRRLNLKVLCQDIADVLGHGVMNGHHHH
ncbi:hypothetical protein SDC9_128162 [bioreactor metagenome]|uniref:Uncharacterized protein n=1 Tax=bioreactor metagenome TaxID=1076179 RepID=A0A645CVC3_9ZZZZ